MKQVPKTVRYKRARIFSGNGTLQDFLTEALAQHPVALNRARDIGHQVGYQVINNTRQQPNVLFGNFVFYTRGVHQQLLVMAHDAPEFDLEEVPIPEKGDGKRREFLNAILFFAVSGNHVALVESRSLKARDLELYLGWLLREHTNVLPAEDNIVLADNTTPATRERIRRAHVKSVSFGAGLTTRPAENEEGVQPAIPRERRGQRERRAQWLPSGLGFDMLKAIMGEGYLKDLRLADSLDEANMKVKLTVEWSRKTTEHAQDLLDNIAVSLRHMEEDDVTINLVRGGKVKGNDLKLSGTLNVQSHNGMPDKDDVYLKMLEWLQTKIRQGLVS